MLRVQVFDAEGKKAWRDVAIIWELEVGIAYNFSAEPMDIQHLDQATEVAAQLTRELGVETRITDATTGIVVPQKPQA